MMPGCQIWRTDSSCCWMGEVLPLPLLPLSLLLTFGNVFCHFSFFLHSFRFASFKESKEQSPRLREVELKVSAKRWKQETDIDCPIGIYKTALRKFNSKKAPNIVKTQVQPSQDVWDWVGENEWDPSGASDISSTTKSFFSSPKILFTTMPRTLVLGTQGVH